MMISLDKTEVMHVCEQGDDKQRGEDDVYGVTSVRTSDATKCFSTFTGENVTQGSVVGDVRLTTGSS